MIDFDKVIAIAYKYLSEIEDVYVLSPAQLLELGYNSFKEGWEIPTEVQVNGKLRVVTLHFLFQHDFPLSLPKVYIKDFDYENIKYIPHVDENRLVCTYDEENTKTDVSNIEGIVRDTLKRTKDIIKEGLEKSNYHEFKDEFLAYWDQSYLKEDVVFKDVLTFFSDEPAIGLISSISFKNRFKDFSSAIFNDIESEKRFKAYLTFYGIEYIETKAFYIGGFFKDAPPLAITAGELLKHLKNHLSQTSLKEFIRYINTKPFGIIISKAELSNKLAFVGFRVAKTIKTDRDGFRPGIVSNFRALGEWHKNDLLRRIYLQDMSPNRIGYRTEGLNYKGGNYKFLVAGIGSIGSNLISLLNTLGNCDFHLIDPETLNLENIGRHLLGFMYIGQNKTLALKEHLLSINPLQSVDTFEGSIFTVAPKGFGMINTSDYLFIAIGKSNIESWIVDSMKEGNITKPVFILWVEPYLYGGHCIYIHPQSVNYQEHFDENGLYKYNIISANEYLNINPLLVLNEAGCQTSFVPFSRNSIVLFLNAIFPAIQQIITKGEVESKRITWTGDLEKMKDMKIELSAFAKDLDSRSVYQ